MNIIKIQESIQMMILIQLSEMLQQQLAINKKTNEVVIIEDWRGEELAYSPINNPDNLTELDKKENFIFVDNEAIKPLQNLNNTITSPLYNGAVNLTPPQRNGKLSINDFIIKGEDCDQIRFNSLRKENMYSQKITGNKSLQKIAYNFEQAILQKLSLGISRNAVISTHRHYKEYLSIVKDKEENKILRLTDLLEKVKEDTAKSATESVRTTSRLNEKEVKEVFKQGEKKQKDKFKIQVFTVLGIMAVISFAMFYFKVINPPTLSTHQEHAAVVEQTIVNYSDDDIKKLIKELSASQNLEIYPWRTGKIIEDVKSQKLTAKQTETVIINGFTKEY